MEPHKRIHLGVIQLRGNLEPSNPRSLRIPQLFHRSPPNTVHNNQHPKLQREQHRGKRTMCQVTCPYKTKCKSHPAKCHHCRRNTGKKDYYQPEHDYYYPYNPPYYPYTWYPYWNTTGTTATWNVTTNWTTNYTATGNTYPY